MMDKTFSEYCTQTSCSMCDYPSQCMKSKKTCEELWQANHDKQIRNEVIEDIKNILYKRARHKGIYASEYIAFIDCSLEQMKRGTE